MNNQENDKMQVAFIGGGVNSVVGSAHYAAINLDNSFELVAGFFSRDKDINSETAVNYKVSSDRVYKNLEDLIKYEKKNIDAIIVLTPTSLHTSHVIDLLKNGIPVISEKALAASASDIMKIKNMMKRNNGFLSVIYNYLGYPMVRELKNIIETGKLGKVNHIQVEMPQEGFIRVNPKGEPIIPQNWRLSDNHVPTISLDLGVHLHMLIKYLVTEIPLNVFALSESIGNFSSIIDNVNCLIEYSNNITCNMWYSKIAIGQRNGMKIRVYGKQGSAEWLQENPEVLKLADSSGHRWTLDRGNDEVEISNKNRYTRFKVGHPAGFIEAFANYYADIANSFQKFKMGQSEFLTECFGVEEALEGTQLFESIQRSSKSKLWEKVALNN